MAEDIEDSLLRVMQRRAATSTPSQLYLKQETIKLRSSTSQCANSGTGRRLNYRAEQTRSADRSSSRLAAVEHNSNNRVTLKLVKYLYRSTLEGCFPQG